MFDIVCKKCGASINNMYMVERGNNIGLYCKCSEDGTYVKWVDKKTVDKLKQMGVSLDASLHGKCIKCGSTDTIVKSNGPHKGLYCANCGKWLKWLSKKEKR